MPGVGLLGFTDIVEENACGNNAASHLFAAESGKVKDLKMIEKNFFTGRVMKYGGASFCDTEIWQEDLGSLEQRGKVFRVRFIDKEFCRAHPGQLINDEVSVGRIVLKITDKELSSAEIEKT